MPNFDRDLLFLIHDVARLLRVDADKRARAHGMTRAQWAILIWLERQSGLSQKELAEILEVEPITVARLIDRLQARGMVERRPDPKDRRIWRLHLRPPAIAVLGEIDEQRAAITELITHGIDQDALRFTTDTLLEMKERLCAEARAPRRAETGVERPAKPASERPAKPASERPAKPASERPAKPASEHRTGPAFAVAREAV